MVMANNVFDVDDRGCGRRHFHQRTYIKACSLNPQWDEIIDIPVCRTTNASSLVLSLSANGIFSIDDCDMSNFFQWDKKHASRENIIMKWWTSILAQEDR